MPASLKSKRPLHTLTPKGRATRAAILESARQVFTKKGYYDTSISQISRQCGVSMGTFYQYFKNKEAVFMELNNLIIDRFLMRIAGLNKNGGTFETRFKELIRRLIEHTRENFQYHRILGESELIDGVTIGYYESQARVLRDFFQREAAAGTVQDLDPNMLAYSLIGISYFNCMEWGPHELNPDSETLLDAIFDFAVYGIRPTEMPNLPDDWQSATLPEPESLRGKDAQPLTKGEQTRQALLDAAEIVFGRSGINQASIVDITQQAGVAQGTFYVHFKSKTALIEGFVRHVNHTMRRTLQRYINRAENRLSAERIGLLAFFEFVRRDRAIYRVVPEFEPKNHDVSLWYYQKLADGYIRGLEHGLAQNEIRQIAPVFLARSLMGIAHFLGLKWIIWNESPKAQIPSPVFRDLVQFIFCGLKQAPNESK